MSVPLLANAVTVSGTEKETAVVGDPRSSDGFLTVFLVVLLYRHSLCSPKLEKIYWYLRLNLLTMHICYPHLWQEFNTIKCRNVKDKTISSWIFSKYCVSLLSRQSSVYSHRCSQMLLEVHITHLIESIPCKVYFLFRSTCDVCPSPSFNQPWALGFKNKGEYYMFLFRTGEFAAAYRHQHPLRSGFDLLVCYFGDYRRSLHDDGGLTPVNTAKMSLRETLHSQMWPSGHFYSRIRYRPRENIHF